MGHFQKAETEEKYLAEMHGFVEHDPCDRRDRLVLILPAAVDLPSSNFATITLVLPHQFELSPPKEWQWQEHGETRMFIDEVGQLSGFDRFEFVLSSDDPDSAEIVATYDGR
jgi:hypothetical protein